MAAALSRLPGKAPQQIRRVAVDLERLAPRGLPRHQADGRFRHPEMLGKELDQRGIGGAIHRRTRDPDLEEKPPADLYDALHRIATALRRQAHEQAHPASKRTCRTGFSQRRGR